MHTLGIPKPWLDLVLPEYHPPPPPPPLHTHTIWCCYLPITFWIILNRYEFEFAVCTPSHWNGASSLNPYPLKSRAYYLKRYGPFGRIPSIYLKQPLGFLIKNSSYTHHVLAVRDRYVSHVLPVVYRCHCQAVYNIASYRDYYLDIFCSP